MPGPASWECSATYLSALRAAVEQAALLPRVQQRLDVATRAALDAPHAQAWWPSERLVSLLVAVEEVGGAGTVRQAGISASHDGMGKLVRPLTSVLLAFSRTPLESLLSRVSTFANVGLRGIEARWKKEAEGRGAVSFSYPQPVPALVAELWHGFFSVGFSLARQGSIRAVRIEPLVHHFDIEWS